MTDRNDDDRPLDEAALSVALVDDDQSLTAETTDDGRIRLTLQQRGSLPSAKLLSVEQAGILARWLLYKSSTR